MKKTRPVSYTHLSSSKAIGAKYNRYCDGFLGKIEEEGKELY